MKLLLTSSGITNNNIAQALSDLARRPLTDLCLLFIPTAANTDGGDKRWLIENLIEFQKQNFRSIDILDVAAVAPEIWQTRLLNADVICFGGGNSNYLAEVFGTINMKSFLKNLPQDTVYMGISAGSMAAGKFIANEQHQALFPEENDGETTKGPMELYDFCFIPHLNSSHFTHIRKDKLEQMKDGFISTVYSTDDETAIKIDNDGKLKVIGGGDYWVSLK